jgi:titin
MSTARRAYRGGISARTRRKRQPVLETLERYTLLSFLVNNAESSGPGSLAQAIQEADDSGRGTIQFNIDGGGAHVIATNGLPAITCPIVIDGTSQPGYTGTPLITIGGPGSSGVGLMIGRGGNGSVVRGLTVTGFGIGIEIEGSGRNSITQNVLSGNGAAGLVIDGAGATGNVVAGNKIGTSAQGTSWFSNDGYGVILSDGASRNTIGGTSGSAGNVISGNEASGIMVTDHGTSGNVIEGNLIGTGAAGNGIIANGANGIIIESGASSNTVGGLVAGAANVISGNPYSGVAIGGSGTTSNVVEGNLIGTNRAGTMALPNQEGVDLYGGTSNNMVGGTTAAARNLISGNVDNGVDIHDPGTTGNRVRGNYIGTGLAGVGPLGNEGDGVLVVGGACCNTIGGTVPNAGNRIAFNLGNGVAIGQSPSQTIYGVSVYANSIFGNAQLGIDLGDDGRTPNAAYQNIQGPNRHADFPVLTSATNHGSTLTITGTVVGAPGSLRLIEFYASPANSSGPTPPEVCLGSINVWTNAKGTAQFSVTLTVPFRSNCTVRATATDSAGNTSEYSSGLYAPWP